MIRTARSKSCWGGGGGRRVFGEAVGEESACHKLGLPPLPDHGDW